MDGDQTTDTMQNGTSRERPESAPYLRFKNIQGTTIENIWKFFFKKVFGTKKVAYCRKPQKKTL